MNFFVAKHQLNIQNLVSPLPHSQLLDCRLPDFSRLIFGTFLDFVSNHSLPDQNDEIIEQNHIMLGIICFIEKSDVELHFESIPKCTT